VPRRYMGHLVMPGLIAGLLSVGIPNVAGAQQTPFPPQSMIYVRNCPKGHRIQFELSSATLYIGIPSLGPHALYETFHWQVGTPCPTAPVRLDPIDLGEAVAQELGIESGFGQRGTILLVSGVHQVASPPQQSKLPYPTGDVSSLPPAIAALLSRNQRTDLNPGATEPWVEMPVQVPGPHEERSYFIHYPATPNFPAQICYASCTGPVGRRLCSVGDHVFPELHVSVSYSLSQFEFGIPESPPPGIAQLASADPKTESGALLQFETRLRAWIAQTEQPPS